MAKRPKKRIYWRNRGGEERAYGDFRDFRDVGGRQEALIPPGYSKATTDPDIARKLATDRVAELEEARRRKGLTGLSRSSTLAEYALYHLRQKAQTDTTDQWMRAAQKHLETAIEYLGRDRDLAAIAVEEIQAYALWLQERPNGRGGTLATGTARQYLNSLSNLFSRASSEGYVLPGFNPVAALLDKPKPARHEAKWLEVHQAARLLDAARAWERDRVDGFSPSKFHAVLATFLLTGGRKSEVLGLNVGDISFDRGTVSFRPNQWRRLKSHNSHRTVPLWPQLKNVLTAYLESAELDGRGLLFPSPIGNGAHKPIRDLRKAIDTVAQGAGWKKGEIRTKMFRHTYCAARLQTLDNGAPVAEYTVARELGHGGTQLIRRVYGHLGRVRHRAEAVEYRVENHPTELRRISSYTPRRPLTAANHRR